jgi:N-acetylglucosamine-6-phosphate deacetylase
VDALSRVPARAIGRGHDLGSLAPGRLGVAVLLTADLRVRGVWVDGVLV